MTDPKTIRTTLERGAIKCPYCRHKELEPLEYNMSGGDTDEIQCERCEATFTVECEIEVWYRGIPKRKTTSSAAEGGQSAAETSRAEVATP